MTYQETLEYMYAQLPMYHRIGAAAYKADLRPTLDMMVALHHPEQRFASIHVAGTNGKGSVSHFLASILQEAGLKVGLYTSPHLVDFRERIRINGEMIPQAEVVEFVEHTLPSLPNGLSFFEMTVGLAFDYFARQQVDVAVVEVGMGGRLDSTNVITPLLSVITNIGLDHTQFLGDTLEKIAHEKGGIIKPNVPVVVGETQPETEPVFRSIAASNNAPITFADARWHLHELPSNPDEGILRYLIESLVGDDGLVPHDYPMCSPLSGSYQLKNLSTVAEAVRVLSDTYPHFATLNTHLADGIAHVVANTHLQGRWQVIGHQPLTVCETAHNAPGIDAMLDKLATIHFRKLHVVYGCVNDKDYRKILSHISTRLTSLGTQIIWYFSQPSVPRGLPVAELQNAALELDIRGAAFTHVAEAIAEARALAQSDDMVLITGSIFLVADALSNINGTE